MGINNKKSFIMAERLKQLREGKGLSHDKLSKALFDQYGVKISSDSLMNYEVADASHTKALKNQGMRVEYLRCLGDFYGVSADYLLGITDIKSMDADLRSSSEYTGLSEDAVKWLRYIKDCHYARDLSKLLEKENFQKIVVHLIDYVISEEAEVIHAKIALKHFPPGGDFNEEEFNNANARYLKDLDDVIEKCAPRYCMKLRALRGLDSVDLCLGMLLFDVENDGDPFTISDISVNRINRYLQNLLQEISSESKLI